MTDRPLDEGTLMAGHEPPRATEPHIFWRGHTARLVDCVLALADELDADGDPLAAARLRNVLYLDYDPLPARLPELGTPPGRRPRPDVASEPGS